MISKKELEIKVSKLKDYSAKRPGLEQYTTPSRIVSELVWFAYMNKDIYGKEVCDLGCGNGVLGISALLLGAKKVYFVDIDSRAISVVRDNCKELGLKNYELINKGIGNIVLESDVVLMNPPFGVQSRGVDTSFFHEAMNISPLIYAIYKKNGYEHVNEISKSRGYECELMKNMKMKLKKKFSYHTSEKAFTDIILLRLENI